MNAHSERALNDAVEALNEIANRPALDRSVRAVLVAEAACLLEQMDLEKSLDETEPKAKEGEKFTFEMTETLEAILTINHFAQLQEMRLRGAGPGTDDHTIGDLMRRVGSLTSDHLRRRFGRWASSVQLAFSQHFLQRETQNPEPLTPEEGHA